MTDDCYPWEVTEVYEVFLPNRDSALVVAISAKDAIDKFVQYWQDMGVSYDRETLIAKSRRMLM